jgi:hypothetical protein
MQNETTPEVFLELEIVQCGTLIRAMESSDAMSTRNNSFQGIGTVK